jgi:hypothetical protein
MHSQGIGHARRPKTKSASVTAGLILTQTGKPHHACSTRLITTRKKSHIRKLCAYGTLPHSALVNASSKAAPGPGRGILPFVGGTVKGAIRRSVVAEAESLGAGNGLADIFERGVEHAPEARFVASGERHSLKRRLFRCAMRMAFRYPRPVEVTPPSWANTPTRSVSGLPLPSDRLNPGE